MSPYKVKLFIFIVKTNLFSFIPEFVLIDKNLAVNEEIGREIIDLENNQQHPLTTIVTFRNVRNILGRLESLGWNWEERTVKET